MLLYVRTSLDQQLLCLILRSFMKNSPTKFLVFKRQAKVKIPLWKQVKDSAPRGWGLQYKSDGDAHRLALGCTLQTLIGFLGWNVTVFAHLSVA